MAPNVYIHGRGGRIGSALAARISHLFTLVAEPQGVDVFVLALPTAVVREKYGETGATILATARALTGNPATHVIDVSGVLKLPAAGDLHQYLSPRLAWMPSRLDASLPCLSRSSPTIGVWANAGCMSSAVIYALHASGLAAICACMRVSTQLFVTCVTGRSASGSAPRGDAAGAAAAAAAAAAPSPDTIRVTNHLGRAHHHVREIETALSVGAGGVRIASFTPVVSTQAEHGVLAVVTGRFQVCFFCTVFHFSLPSGW